MERNKNRILVMLIVAILSILSTCPLYAQSNTKEVTMSVGETQTFYLPSSVTSKSLKSINFYSSGISYVQVVSYTNYSVTVKAIKAFSSPVIVRCDYYYYVRNGSYTYLASGFYDYSITIAGSGGNNGDSGVKPTSIKFSSSAVGISVGESRQLIPTIQPANAEYTLTWSIINGKSVASVSQDGLLVGKTVGAADLKVIADNGVYAMLRVVVSEPKPTSVSVSPSSVTLTEGESRYLTASVYPTNASQSVSWSSNDSSIVNINSSGKITAIKAGIATITATTPNGKTGTCSVTCKEAIQSIILSDKDGITELPETANLIYERRLYFGWNSVCVPFAINKSMLDAFCVGCKIATVVKLEVVGSDRFLSVNDVQSVNAGVPCLIYAPKDVTCKFSISGVSLNATPINTGNIRGVYVRTNIGANYYKLANNGKSFGLTCSDEAIVAPFRAYIIPDVIPQTKSSSKTIKMKVTEIQY